MMVATCIEDDQYMLNDGERSPFRNTVHSPDKMPCSWAQDDPELAVKDIDDEFFGPLPDVATPLNLETSPLITCSPPQLLHQTPYFTNAPLDPGFDYDLLSLPGTPYDTPLTRLPSPMIYDPEHRSYGSAGSFSLQDTHFPSLNGQCGYNIAHSLMEWIQDSEDLTDLKLMATSQPASPPSLLFPAAETVLVNTDAGQPDTSSALSLAPPTLPNVPSCDNTSKDEEAYHSFVKVKPPNQCSSPCQPQKNAPSTVEQAVLDNIPLVMEPDPTRKSRQTPQSDCRRYSPYHMKTEITKDEDRMTGYISVIKPVIGTDNIRKASAKRRKRSGNHICSICEKDFTTKTNLQYHLNAHSGSRPYKCVYCGRGFNSKSCQTRHERLQHKGKPASSRKFQ